MNTFSPPTRLHHHVIGFLSADSGLGQSGRILLHKLEQEGRTVHGTALSTGDSRTGRVKADAWRGEPHARNTSSGQHIQWVHVNPPEVTFSWGCNEPRQVQDESAFKVAVPFWELEKLPADWVRTLNAFDAVAAPTTFIRKALEASGVTAPIVDLPLITEGLDEAGDVAGDRQRFGLPEEGFLFLSHFDLSSGPSRKNPEAAVRAFMAAFHDRREGPEVPHLVVAMNNPEVLDLASDAIKALMDQTQAFPNIHWRPGHIAEADLPAFRASFDAVVSLHRAEGLGLVPLEMMAIGKPAVVTAYSGNMAYCTPENAALVTYDRVPVRALHPLYHNAIKEHPDLRWAEAHIDKAAEAMQRLVDDPAHCAALAAQARKDVRRHAEASWAECIAEVEALAAESGPRSSAVWEERYAWCSCPFDPDVPAPKLSPALKAKHQWSDFKRKLGWNFRIFRK